MPNIVKKLLAIGGFGGAGVGVAFEAGAEGIDAAIIGVFTALGTLVVTILYERGYLKKKGKR